MILFLISMHKPSSFPPPAIDSVYSTPLFAKKKKKLTAVSKALKENFSMWNYNGMKESYCQK